MGPWNEEALSLRIHCETEPMTALQNHKRVITFLKCFVIHPKLAHGELALDSARFKRIYSLIACFFCSENAEIVL